MNPQSPKSISAEDLYEWILKRSIKPILVDVREDKELELASFTFDVIHMPLSKSKIWMSALSDYLPSNAPIVVICHAGIRSWQFGLWLIEHSWEGDIWNLEGGIDSWSMKIDPSIPRY
tara:strand:+ start:944 stop:1297 length:354 start_codon:yes stop_codon:yes gene_type:complete